MRLTTPDPKKRRVNYTVFFTPSFITEEVENVLAYQRSERPSVQLFQRSQKCKKLTTTDNAWPQ